MQSEKDVPLEEAIDRAGFGLYSYILICLTGLGIISFACISFGSTILVPASACELRTTTGQQGALAAAPIVGAILGTLIWGYLADTRGRKRMLMISLLGAAIVNAVASISINWIMLMLLQFVASIFASGVYSMFMSLISESVPMGKRNLVVLLVSSIFLLSQGIMAVLAIPIIPLSFSHHISGLGIYWNSWRTLMVVYCLPSIFTALCLLFMQESPKFLYVVGKREEALSRLSVIYKINKMSSKAEYTVKSLSEDLEEKKEKLSAVKEQIVPLFRQPLLKYTVIMTLLFVLQMVGSFAVWLPTILNQFVRILETGDGMDQTVCGVLDLALHRPVQENPDTVPCAINETALLMVLMVGVMQSIVNSILSLIINKVGRRNLVIVVCAVCGGSGILVNLVPNAYGSVALFGIFLIGFIVIGLYTAIIVALFPTHLRALAIAVPLTCGRLAGFAVIQILNFLLTNDCNAGFYIFCTLFTSSAVIASFLPNDRTLRPPPSEEKELTQKEELPHRTVTEL